MMHKAYSDFSLLFLYCGLIFLLSHQPTLPIAMDFPQQDKLVHALAYAVMAVLAWRSFSHWRKPKTIILIAALLFSSMYGVSDEFHQSFIEGRDASVWDWLADTVGALIAVSVLARRGIKDDCRD